MSASLRLGLWPRLRKHRIEFPFNINDSGKTAELLNAFVSSEVFRGGGVGKKIFEAIHKKLVNQKGGKWISVETARESASAEKLLKTKFSAKDHVEYSINQDLVAGTRITVNGEEELNNSLQSKLNKLFK